MNPQAIASPNWSTASFAHAADTSASDLSTLCEHLNLCRGLQSRLFRLQCAAETLHGFVTARFVTTLTLVAVVLGVVSLVS